VGDEGEILAGLSRFLEHHLEHCLAATLFVGRLADILSTRLATPTLRLEANPLVRKLGWPFAWATLLVSLLPYAKPWGSVVAVPVIVASFFVAAQNLSRAWMMRALGEEEYLAFTRRAFAKARPALVYGSIAVSSSLIAGAGLLLLLFYPEDDAWAHWFALGIVLYAGAIALHGSLAARRSFRAVRET
jgi:hypothetical protein